MQINIEIKKILKKRDINFLIIGSFVSVFISCILALSIPFDIHRASGLWFGADTIRVIDSFTDPLKNSRVSLHPLIKLIIIPITRPPYELIMNLTELRSGFVRAFLSQLIISFSAGINWSLMYSIFTKIGLSCRNSFVVSCFWLSSAGFIFWWSSPETFPLGSLTILLILWLLAYNIKSKKVWIISVIASASITITNLMIGIMGLYVLFSKRIFVELLSIALISILSLSIIQRSYMPAASLALQKISRETEFIKPRIFPIQSLSQFFVLPIISTTFPEVVFTNASAKISHYQLQFKNFNHTNFFSFKPIIAFVWLILLGKGFYTCLNTNKSPLSLTLCLFICCQFVLHLFYGDINGNIFLYTPHYLSCLILVAAYGMAKDHRVNERLIFWLFLVLTFSCLFFNYFSFRDTVDLAYQHVLNS